MQLGIANSLHSVSIMYAVNYNADVRPSNFKQEQPMITKHILIWNNYFVKDILNCIKTKTNPVNINKC